MKFDKCIKKYSSPVDIILGNIKPERWAIFRYKFNMFLLIKQC